MSLSHKPMLGLRKPGEPPRRPTSLRLAPKEIVDPVWVIDSEEEAHKLVALLYQQPLVAVDTETTGLNYMKDRVVVWSISWGNRVFLHGDVIPILKPWLEDASRAKIFHNRKYDCHIFQNHGVDVQGPCYDTMIMHWLLDENVRHGLKELVTTLLHRDRVSYKALFGKIPLQLILRRDIDGMIEFFAAKLKKYQLVEGLTWVPNKFYKDLFLNATDDEDKARARLEGLYDRLVDYATDDALDTFELFNLLKGKLSDLPVGKGNMWDYYERVEEPFGRVLMFTERNGFKLDTEFLAEVAEIVDTEIQKVEFNFYKAAKQEIDIGSTKQLIKLFYHDLKYPVVKTTPSQYCTQCLRDATKATGYKCKEHGSRFLAARPSTDDEVLEKLFNKSKKKYALAGMLMEYRGLAKLQSTYVKGLTESVDYEYRCRTALHQHGTLTGRLSSGDKRNGYPNLQNIPTHEKDVYGIRHSFVAPEGYGLIVLDYSQIELRLLAHFSQDKSLIKVYTDGGDLHAEVAKKVWKVDESHPNWGGFRRYAKGINFGIIYGMGPWKLAKEIDVSEDEAVRYIEDYFKGYPGVERFIRETHYTSRSRGFVSTILGRRRRILEIQSDDPKIYGHGKRQSVNSVIQGSASDVVKMAMLKTSEKFNPRVKAFGAKLLLQVHDELVFECPLKNIDEAKIYIQKEMEHPFHKPLLVPLTVDGAWGMSWGECK